MPITYPVVAPAGTTLGPQDPGGLLAINSAQLKIDMFPQIFWADRGAAPALAIASMEAHSRPAKAIQPQWLEIVSIPQDLTPSTSYTSGATSVVLTTGEGAWVNTDDVILDANTGEYMQVTAVSTDTLTVTRGYLGTTAHAIASTDHFINMRQISGHGTDSPEALQVISATKSNYCETRKTTVKVTKTQEAVETYGGSVRLQQRALKAQEHILDFEQRFLHGQMGSITNVNQPVYSLGGLDHFVTTNVWNLSGQAMTEAAFLDYLPQVFFHGQRPGKRVKVMYVSAEISNTINSWGLGKLMVSNDTNEASRRYGIDIKEYVNPYGKLYIVYHPLLYGAFSGWAYIVDMPSIWLRPLRPTKLNTNIQNPQSDYFLDEYLTESSIQVADQILHGIIQNASF